MPRTKPTEKEWKIVLARSGGVCAFPGCDESLTKSGNDQDETAFIGEVAHIVSDSRQGPRGDVELSDEERDKHPNLVLFCQNCHDRVDKQVRTFSVPVLKRIKEQHESRIAAPDLACWPWGSLGVQAGTDSQFTSAGNTSPPSRFRCTLRLWRSSGSGHQATSQLPERPRSDHPIPGSGEDIVLFPRPP